MRIGFLFDDAYGGRGGIAQFNRDFIEACCADETVDEMVLFQRIGPQEPPAPPPAKARYAIQPTVFGYGPDVSARYVAATLRHLARDRHFDLVVCGHLYLLPLGVAAAAIARARLVTIMHGVEAWEPSNHRLANLLARRTRHFISVSRHTFDRFVAWTGNRRATGHILWNTVDLERFRAPCDPAPLRERLGLAGRRVIFTLGRLSSQERYKGYDEILEVLPRLRAEFPDLIYVLGGEGDDRVRLQAKARELGVADATLFTGYIAEEDKRACYAMAEVFLLAGRGEGFGIVLLEALASGCRVIASRLDASAEAVGDGRLGTVVDPLNPEELASAIADALRRGRPVAAPDLTEYGQVRYRRQVREILAAVVGATGR